MRTRILLAALLALPALAQAETGTEAFARLKQLEGTWEGHIGAPDGPPGTAIYAVTGGGNVLTETLFPGTPHEMLTVYHLDGGELVLTHYCAGGTQPRMRRIPSAVAGEIAFDFTGGSNIAPGASHMHAARMRVLGPDTLESEWDAWKDGARVGSHKFYLKRQKS